MILLLKNLLFTSLVPGTVAVYIPLLIANKQSLTSGLFFCAAIIILVLGAGIYIWCIWDFAIFGRGTPAPIDQPKRLVVRGLYRYTRNPMYVGVLTVILGWAILFRAVPLLFYAIGVGTVFHLFIVFYEERHLQRKFGDEYNDYRSRTGRWLPRLRRRRTA